MYSIERSTKVLITFSDKEILITLCPTFRKHQSEDTRENSISP